MNFLEWPINYKFAGINCREQLKNSRNHKSLYLQKFPPFKYFTYVSYLHIGSDDWQKQAENVCYETRDEKPGRFTMKDEGLLVGLKLVHRSGYVNCDKARSECLSRWACACYSNGTTVITNYKKAKVFKVKDLTNDITKNHFGVNGETSPDLVFINSVQPIYASRDMELQIWYSQDLDDFLESNNGGKHCVDVYAQLVSPKQHFHP